MINNSLCKQWGWTPADAVGKVIEGTLEGKVTIVGVTEDYHFASLKQPIIPMVMMQGDFAKARDFFTNFVLVRIQLDHAKEALDFLRTNWEQTVTESPFDYFFLNEKLNTAYDQEDKLNRIATVFSGFAILIGCLGLYGLSLFTFRKRKKEVAIRKVLGASEQTIVRLFTVDFPEAGDTWLRYRHASSVVPIGQVACGFFVSAYAVVRNVCCVFGDFDLSWLSQQLCSKRSRRRSRIHLRCSTMSSE
ncbi:MAG: FtsX-like permease family protein [Bacteroidota bacterium]